MPRLSINELTTFRWSFEEDVLRYRQAGITAMGLWREKLSDYGEEKGKELLDEAGMAVSNLLWAGGFTGSDGRTFRESLEDAEEAIYQAADLDARCLIIYTGSRGGHTVRHARRLVTDALSELAPLARQMDVTLALEPMHAGCNCGCTFLNDFEETIEILDTVRSRHVGLALDTYHFGTQDRLLDYWIPEIAPRLAMVHLGDARRPPQGEQDRCRLGEGLLPLAEIVAALLEADYDGDFDVELLGQEIEASDYTKLITDSRDAFQMLLQDAEQELRIRSEVSLTQDELNDGSLSGQGNQPQRR